jgi:hypothetical protein
MLTTSIQILLGKVLGLPVIISARGTDINLFASFRRFLYGSLGPCPVDSQCTLAVRSRSFGNRFCDSGYRQAQTCRAGGTRRGSRKSCSEYRSREADGRRGSGVGHRNSDYTSRTLGIPIRGYVRSIWLVPAAAILPFSICTILSTDCGPRIRYHFSSCRSQWLMSLWYIGLTVDERASLLQLDCITMPTPSTRVNFGCLTTTGSGGRSRT